ncbi:MAG: hypothetical protein UV73_C0003G0066 [Candidatus Gottesmanbacteria bacterium GW2011_GWA2_43_14]|uniref:L,D-TPase catalytic domain-containing protein n=1 Tax=Candidatus Gottesmanbacteria bacterium GW2011_GWA2_43_14 TaxID=1618443 RepID=A0A0G1DKG4_9BACT|nr:MAG: hypothetical protein UV73_C0003G0066 [Candidatus Gottesmanbacteria bacterium GW2011_GWA2_43_14]
MRKTLILVWFMLFLSLAAVTATLFFYRQLENKNKKERINKENFWFLLERQSNLETLYYGQPGRVTDSKIVRQFKVKTGRPNERPTPLPQLLGREYWLISGKTETKDNPETGPYFISLDIPVTDDEPYGPEKYPECEGRCNWVLPGAFGLHGIGGDDSKLTESDPGSSGCIRHTDEDITHLYNLIDPTKSIRYYIENS